MADDIKLVIGVDNKGVLSAIKSTEALESKVKKLSDTYARGGISSGRYQRGLDALSNSTGKAKKELQAYGTQIRAAEKSSKMAAEASKQETAAVKAYALARRQALEEDRRRDAVVKSNIAALNQQRIAYQANTKELYRIRMATDSVFAAEQKLLKVKTLLRAEVANGNMTMREAARVQMDYKQSLANMSNGLVQGRNKMNKFGMVSQQVGYQVGDFFVQVQSGQSAMVAFAQQGTQLAGLLPGIAGAVVGIGLSFAGMVYQMMRAKREAAGAGDSTKRFEDNLKSAREQVKGMKDDLELLKSGFSEMFEKTLTDNIEDAKKKLAEARKDLASLGFGEALVQGGLGGVPLLGYLFDTEADRRAVENAEARVKAAEDELESAKRTAWELQNIKDLHEQTVMVVDSQAEATEKVRAKAVEYLDAVSSLEGKYGEAVVTALALAKVDLTSPISSAVIAAAQLATNLGIALSAAQQIQLEQTSLGNKNQVYSGRGTVGMPGETETSGRFSPSKDIVSQADILLGLKDPPKTRGSKKKGGGSKESPQEKLAEYIANKEKELELETKLVGIFDTEREIQSDLFKARNEYSGVITPAQEKELENTLRQTEAIKEQQTVLEEAKAQQEALADTISGAMGDAFMSIVDGTKSAGDAFKDMAKLIISELFKILVVEKMVKSISGAISGAFGGGVDLASANGNVFNNGSHVQAYANGGVVGGPTYFPMSGGKTGLMGEAGPEAIMPLKRGSNGKLGVQMEGGATTTVVQNFNFQANGDDSVKKLIAQAAPKIAQMTKSSLLDDRRRGGTTKAAFG